MILGDNVRFVVGITGLSSRALTRSGVSPLKSTRVTERGLGAKQSRHSGEALEKLLSR